MFRSVIYVACIFVVSLCTGQDFGVETKDSFCVHEMQAFVDNMGNKTDNIW